MSLSNAEGIKSSLTADADEQLVSTINSLVAEIEDLRGETERLRDKVERLEADQDAEQDSQDDETTDETSSTPSHTEPSEMPQRALKRIGELEDTVEDLEDRIADEEDRAGRRSASIQERISELVGEEEQETGNRLSISELEDTVEDLEDRIADEEDRAGRRSASIQERINALESDQSPQDAQEDAGSTGTNPALGTDTDGSTTPRTPLERTVALPEEIATSELTANQERARFVASDVMDYSRSVPAGRSIRSSEIGTVLRAGTECKARSQTVSRVIEFLDSLGGDGVKVVERRGERRVIFDEETARRLQDLGGPDAVDGGERSNHGVVTTGGL